MPIGCWYQRDSGYLAQIIIPTGATGGIYTNQLVVYVDATNARSYPSTGSTTWYDLSGQNNHMTLYNCTGNGINAIVFNGTSSYTLTPNLWTPFSASNFNQTQEVWLNNINNLGTSYTNGVVISELGQPTINTGWHDSQIEIVAGSARLRVWDLNKPGGLAVGNLTGPKWTHLAWRYNAASGTLDGFMNGLKVATTGPGYFRTNPFGTSNQYYSSLGPIDVTNLGDGGYYSGLIGAYRNYSLSLPDDLIYQNYLYDAPRFLNSYSGWTKGTAINITGGAGTPPYSGTNLGAPTNWPVWQLFYANQSVSFNKIRQYTNTNGNNSWVYYIAIPKMTGTMNFTGTTGTLIGSQSSTSYTAGGSTITSLSSTITVPSNNYFLIGCVDGPYYKVFNTGPPAYAFYQTGALKYTMLNKSYYITHSSGSTVMELPAALGGSRVFNNVNGFWVMGLEGVS